jgi:hypothetical protein
MSHEDWHGIDDPFGDDPFGMEDLQLFGDPLFRVGVPFDAPERFKKYVFAAAKTCVLGNVSVDHTLKSYGSLWRFQRPSPSDKILVEAIWESKRWSRHAFHSMHHTWKPAHMGIAVSWAALYRLQATIRCISFAIRQGFHFECATLERLMLEQLAWVSEVRTIDDPSYFEVQPTSCIKTLKRTFPGIGRIYGALTQRAHLVPERTKSYLEADERGQITALMADARFAKLDAAHLLALTDIYIVLCELLVADLLERPLSVYRRRGNWIPKQTRPFLKIVRRLSRRLLEVRG